MPRIPALPGAATPPVGSVDENGVFTAGTESASGTLTVTYQDGVSASIPVSVAGHVNTLES